MIIYNSSSVDNHNLSNKNQSKSKPKRIAKKNFKVKSSTNSSKKLKLTKKNQLYLKSIQLKLKK